MPLDCSDLNRLLMRVYMQAIHTGGYSMGDNSSFLKVVQAHREASGVTLNGFSELNDLFEKMKNDGPPITAHQKLMQKRETLELERKTRQTNWVGLVPARQHRPQSLLGLLWLLVRVKWNKVWKKYPRIQVKTTP